MERGRPPTRTGIAMVAGGLLVVLAVLLGIGGFFATLATFDRIEGMKAPTPAQLRETTELAGFLFLAALAVGMLGVVVFLLASARSRAIAARDEALAVDSAEWR